MPRVMLCCLVLLIPALWWERGERKRAKVTEGWVFQTEYGTRYGVRVQAQSIREAASIMAETYAGVGG